ncbi:hypothetical protein GCM10009623_30580 [Nocardioides aestuarii]|uniref:Glycosyltransferase family 2 protein n=1 Tax=Nocardioides aestuarii TaxID=252231 RepID=A0ABW4TR34_9ACTN
MLVTASTVMDSPGNVRFFVEANLASGVDHMLVFLDAPQEPGQQEVAAMLDAERRVTCIRTGRKQWWTDGRPSGLNDRQRMNANWARALLEPFGWAEWLFHIDGDEVARLDRDAIAEVPAEADAIWLPPWEAVSQPDPDTRPTRFKRLLDEDDLTLLHVLEAIREPTNQAYFHGHVMGKSGIRPRSGHALSLHGALTADGDRLERHEDPRLGVLHYDAVSGEEFVRKWQALARAGHARYRKSRQPMARALRTLIAKDLPEEVRARHLRRIYDLTTRDDVDLLGELGLLLELDPLTDPLPARPLADDDARALAARVEELRAVPKHGFHVADKVADKAREAGAGRAARDAGRKLRRLTGRS